MADEPASAPRQSPHSSQPAAASKRLRVGALLFMVSTADRSTARSTRMTSPHRVRFYRRLSFRAIFGKLITNCDRGWATTGGGILDQRRRRRFVSAAE
jgi:hypothetical protein